MKNVSLPTVNNDAEVMLSDSQEYVDLKKYIFWVLATLVPLTAISVAVGMLSKSLTLFTVVIDCGAGLILHTFNMASIIVIQRRNAINFPYGTGKLENFSGFLYAIIIIPMALLIIYSAINRYLHPPVSINLGIVQIPVVLGALRAWILLIWASRICRKYPGHSPMTNAYYVNQKLVLIRNISIVGVLLFGFWFSSYGYLWVAIAIDTVVGVLIALYLSYCAYGVLTRNFKSLIDLPLPESDQYKILQALVADFDEYEGIGNFYTQLSGNTRFVQMELYFKNMTTVEEIESLRMRLEEKLKGHFSKMKFHLIPLAQKEQGEASQGSRGQI